MSVLQLPHPWADAVVLCGLALGGLIAGYRKHVWSLVLLGLAVVLSAFWVPAGTKLGAAEIVPLSLFLGVVAREVIDHRSGPTLPVPRLIVLVILGLGVAAGLSSWLAPEGPSGGPSGLQSPGTRPFVQAASYALLLLFFLIPTWIHIGSKELKTAARGIQLAVTASAIYGVYQFVAQRADLPFRGIQYFAGEAGREGVGLMYVGGVRLFRMSGLSNEPKQLAAVAIVGFVMALLSEALYDRRFSRWLILITCAAAFVGAWSTGGMLAATLVLSAGVVWAAASLRGTLRRTLKVVAALMVIGAVVIGLSGQTVQAVELVREVTFGRVSVPGLVEVTGAGQRIENAVIEHFLNHPLAATTGLGLGNYPYVVGAPGEWVWAGGIQPMHSLPLTLLADFGVFALVLLLIVAIRLSCGYAVRGTNAVQNEAGGRGRSAHRVIFAGLIAALLVSVFVNLLPLILLFIGILHSYERGSNSRGKSNAAHGRRSRGPIRRRAVPVNR